MSKFVVCVDAGHGGVNAAGGFDPGAVSGSRRECDDTLKMAFAVESALVKRGFGVVMPRIGEKLQEGRDRGAYAIQQGAKAFLCIHRNAFNGMAKGFETWTPKNPSIFSRNLAKAVQDRCVAVGANANRGVKTDTEGNYPLIMRVGMPAVLIEYGFVDNADDNALFDKNLTAYAEATAAAVEDVFGKQTAPAPGPAPSGSTYTVKSGDTMSGITSMFGVSLGALAAVNPQIKDLNKIYPGQVVNIPAGSGGSTSSSATPKKTADEVAKEIWNGKGGWGNDPERKAKLIDYGGVEFRNEVQARLNSMK